MGAVGQSPELRVPLDLVMGIHPEKSLSSKVSYVEKLEESIDIVHTFARKRLKITTDRMKTRYNLDATATKLNEGTPVWLFKPQRKKGVSPKLSKSWVGPYVVVKRINDLVYRIQMSECSKSMVVHRNRLRKYFGENIPQFLSRSETMQEHGPELRRSRRERREPVRFES